MQTFEFKSIWRFWKVTYSPMGEINKNFITKWAPSSTHGGEFNYLHKLIAHSCPAWSSTTGSGALQACRPWNLWCIKSCALRSDFVISDEVHARNISKYARNNPNCGSNNNLQGTQPWASYRDQTATFLWGGIAHNGWARSTAPM